MSQPLYKRPFGGPDPWADLLDAAAVALDPLNSPNEGWKALVCAVKAIDPDWTIGHRAVPPIPPGLHFRRSTA